MKVGGLFVLGHIFSVAMGHIRNELGNLMLLQQLALQLRRGILGLMGPLDLHLGHNVPLQQRVKLLVLGNLAEIMEQRAEGGELPDNGGFAVGMTADAGCQ
ncbi:hypothetical protein D3C76_1539760 [compost metagenome]